MINCTTMNSLATNCFLTQPNAIYDGTNGINLSNSIKTRLNTINNSTFGYVKKMSIQSIKEVGINGKNIKFNKTFEYYVTCEEDGYMAFNSKYNIFGYNVEEELAIRDMITDLLFLWDEYAIEDDDKLTESAIKLKIEILSDLVIEDAN